MNSFALVPYKAGSVPERSGLKIQQIRQINMWRSMHFSGIMTNFVSMTTHSCHFFVIFRKFQQNTDSGLPDTEHKALEKGFRDLVHQD
jgi:hypothetical protein